MPLKGLTGEQLYDSLIVATGWTETQPQAPRGFVAAGFQGPARTEFLAKFASTGEKRTEVQTSILQALSLMNGRLVADSTSLERSTTLAAVLDGPFLDNRQRLDTLYLAALSRPMRPDEAERMLKYVSDGGPGKDSRKALADVFWVLLNSTEFFLNH